MSAPRDRLRSALASALYVSLFTALARASAVPLLVFPELGALTTVVIGSPDHAWARSPRLLVLTPVLTGVAGVAVSRWLPYGPAAVTLVVVASLLLIRVLRSPVVPALSAGLLPLALGIRSWQYPAALIPGTLGLALLLILRRRLRGAPDVPPPSAPPRLVGPWLLPLALFLAGALGLVHWLGSPLVLYPPLIVLAWETLARAEACPWRGRPFTLLAVIGVAASTGLLLARSLGPLPLATLLALLLVALLLDRLRLRCPPAFAVVLLPFVVSDPSPAFLPWVLAGTAWLLVVAALARRMPGWPAALP